MRFLSGIGDVRACGLRKGNWTSLARRSCGAFVGVGSRISWCRAG